MIEEMTGTQAEHKIDNTSIANSILKNTAVMMVAQVITWVSGFVLLLFLPRYLGSESFGRLYLAMSIQLICQWLIDYGGQNYITKHVSRDRMTVSELMSNSAALRVGLWIVSLMLTYALCLAASYPAPVILIIMMLGFSNLWTNMTTLLRSCYQGFETMKYPSIGAVVERSFLMLTAIPALLLGARENTIAILMAISTMFSFAICWKYSKRLFKFRLSVHLQTINKLLKDGLPYFLWSLFGIIYYRINAVMLSILTPESVVGWYGAAYRFFDILMFLPAIYSQALYPILTRLSKSESSSMNNTAERSLQFLLLAGIPIAVMLVFFSHDIISLLFGLKEYAPSVILLQIFSVGMLLVYVDFVLGGTVMALDKQKQWAVVAFVAAILNIGLNYLLIPHFQKASGNGGIGAAIATDLTELFIMLSAVTLLPKELFTRRLFTVMLKGIGAGAMLAVGVIGCGRIGLPWIAQGAVGTILYTATLFALSAFEPEEVKYVTEAVFRKNIFKYLSESKRVNS